jgi:hypothetical protein
MCWRLLLFLMAFGISWNTKAQFYQGSNVEFGKNRIQYREFDWLYYPGEHFEVYYYIGGEKFAEYVLMSCEKNLPDLEHFFDFSSEDKIQVLSYLKQSEFRQSNIGITGEEQYNIGGTAKILGSKIFVYYEGDHYLLERQIRQQISRVLFNQMMYGGNWKDVLKSNTLLSMPKWFEEGVISYAADPNNAQIESFIRDKITERSFKSLNRLNDDEAALGGHAFWSYIEQVYGAAVIPNILYMSRLSRNIESGFLFSIGVSLDKVTQEFFQYYRNKYPLSRMEKIPGYPQLKTGASKEELSKYRKRCKQMGDLRVKAKLKYRYTQFRLSPNGQHMAYVTNEKGQYKIWIADMQTGKKKRILKKDKKIERIIDESFPVITWHPSSNILTYVFENKGRALIGNYTLSENVREEKELFRMEKVVDMDYSKDGRRIIFSGVNRGATDLYLYQVIGNNYEQLTNDVFDDLHPRFIDGDEKIIFSSNRLDDTLRRDVPIGVYPTGKDIFIYNLATRSPLLERLSDTPGANEDFPDAYAPGKYTYLGNANGNISRYLVTVDSMISAIDTVIHYKRFISGNIASAYSRSPIDFRVNGDSGQYVLVSKFLGKPVIQIGQSNSRSEEAGRDLRIGKGANALPKDLVWLHPAVDSAKVKQIDIRDYMFEDERKDYTYEKKSVSIEELKPKADSLGKDSAKYTFTLPKSRNYRLNFTMDYVVTQVANTFNNAFYQRYTSPSEVNPGFSALNKYGISDLFEDYKVVGGFRLAGDLQNNTFGVYFENLKHRWDRKIIFQRQTQSRVVNFNQSKVQTHSLTYQIKYPFSELASLRFTFIWRNDRTIVLPVDPITLQTPNSMINNLGLRVEYVYDNTVSRGLNLWNGTRYKFWCERLQRPDVFNKRTDFNVIGGDFRHYQKIHRDLIAAFRLSGATTFGAEKLVHYFGGVDNWLFQKIDNATKISTDQNYQFQTFAGPVRGFWINARNGNSFALINAEIRWPVFKYLLHKPIKSDFVQNFQLVGFFDSGSSWTGKSPFSDRNEFNQTSDGNRYVTVTVNNNRNPIIYGYGYGLRSKVLGYFVRADWAWGVDDGIRLSRVFYLSLNMDF